MKEREEKGRLKRKKEEVEERTKGFSILDLGLIALLRGNKSFSHLSSAGQNKERPPPVPNPDYEVTRDRMGRRGLSMGEEDRWDSPSGPPDTSKPTPSVKVPEQPTLCLPLPPS